MIDHSVSNLKRQIAAIRKDNERLRKEANENIDGMVAATKESLNLLRQITRLKEILVKCTVPYEALLMDKESRKWIAPEIWKTIEDAVQSARIIFVEVSVKPK